MLIDGSREGSTSQITQLTSATNPESGATTYAYVVNSFDLGGRILTQWQCTPLNCGTGWYTLTYTYNLAGGMTTYTDGAGHTFTQTFNAASQITQLTSSLNDAQHPGTLASAFSYNPAGAIAQMTYGNGLVQTVVMNNRLQPCRINVRSAGVSPANCTDAQPAGNFQDFTYTFTDAQGKNNGNVQSWTGTGSAGGGFTRSYTYDELNRLKTMTSTGTCTGLSWTYDIWANRTNQTTTGGTCGQSALTINTLNRIADTGYTYDAAGNMTAEPGQTYQYNAENELTSINSGVVATYVYDAAGRRVRKIAGGSTTEYVYDLAGSVVAEYEGATWTKGYVYLGGLLAQYSNSTTYFMVKDHLSSTRVVANVSGGVAESYDFLPYGEQSGGTVTTKKFTGKERDSESGLDYFGARFCVSLSGRFMSADEPFIDQHPTNPQSWNLYHYARNNPVNLVDLTGNAAEDSMHMATTRPMEGNGGPTDAGISDTSWSIYDNVELGPGRLLTTSLDLLTAPAQNQNQVPPEVKAAIAASVKASNSPTADDKKGGFHEEGGIWGTSTAGIAVPVPAKPGPYSDPSVNKDAHIDVANSANPKLKDDLKSIDGRWHVHPSGTLQVDNKLYFFKQPPSPGDIKTAPFPINIVVGAREKRVYFYNSSGLVGKGMKLKDFMKGPK